MTQWFWWKKTGKPPKEYDEYSEFELVALLQGIDELAQQEGDNSLYGPELSPTLGGAMPSGRRKTIKAPKNLDEAFETGDPVVDEFERQFAAGLTPDM